MTEQASGPIVVGLDGSPSSLAALDWAVRQALATGAPIDVIAAWQWPQSFGYPMPLAAEFDPAADAARVLDQAVTPLQARHPELRIDTHVVEGQAATILVERSADASLLVVGSRGHGELAGMLLGSVSEHCAAHAHCPVLVVRH